MTRRIVTLVGLGFIIMVAISLEGCCDRECQIEEEIAANKAEMEQNGFEDRDNADDADVPCGQDGDSADTADTALWGMDDTADACKQHQSADTSTAQKTTAGNGFVYPLDVVTSWKDAYDYAGFGACGSSYYYSSTCHNGSDIGSARGTSVYAIAAGTVVKVSGTQNSTCSSGWGYDYGGSSTCNMAIAMQHYAADGSPFVVVYGHMVYDSSVATGDTYAPGDTIGTIAYDYDRSSSTASWKKTSSPHLHFGVFPGTSSPAVASGLYGWGKLSCSGASQSARSTFPSSCTNNGSTAPGTYIGAKSWTEPPSAPTLSSPSNGASVTSPVTLSWTNGSGTYRSHIMACTNSSLTTGCMNPDGAMTGQEPSALSTSYSATLSKGTYYWAVRGIAYNDDGGWGSYSTVRYFTVK